MDRLRGAGETAGDGARCLRSHRRLGAFRCGRRLLHHEGSLRWRDGGQNPVDRGKQGIKRSMIVDANGIPLGAIAAPANRHDSPLLDETLETLDVLGSLPERMNVHLDRGYDSETTHQKLKARGLIPRISEKGEPAPLAGTKRWVVERTHSWKNAHKKLGVLSAGIGSSNFGSPSRT